ncbi:hypothetical protein Dimus_008407 [Dionaea muscipula]
MSSYEYFFIRDILIIFFKGYCGTDLCGRRFFYLAIPSECLQDKDILFNFMIRKMAAPGSGGGPSREGAAKATVADQISQAVQSTSNLLHLMQQSSPSQARLVKLPNSLLAKTDIIKNTGQVLEQLPLVISSLDAHIENGLHSLPHIKTVTQVLSNMESCQITPLSQVQELADQSSTAV